LKRQPSGQPQQTPLAGRGDLGPQFNDSHQLGINCAAFCVS